MKVRLQRNMIVLQRNVHGETAADFLKITLLDYVYSLYWKHESLNTGSTRSEYVQCWFLLH